MTAPDLRVFPDAEAVAREARREIVAGMSAAREASREFVLGLAGGRTPQRLYEFLAEDPSIDWSRVRFFWGDERCVPPDDAASNYRLAHDALLSRIEVAPARVHRLRGEAADPEAAAREYEAELASIEAPDLVLLGLGTDGHTASLFPGSAALEESSRLVVPSRAPIGVTPTDRLTLTLPGLARWERALFLVTGSNKRHVLTALLDDPADAERFPAARVRTRIQESWFVDRAAAPENLPHDGGADR
jgi:6-phosphogluconolactonase